MCDAQGVQLFIRRPQGHRFGLLNIAPVPSSKVRRVCFTLMSLAYDSTRKGVVPGSNWKPCKAVSSMLRRGLTTSR
jgi:hypothetical protein